MKARSSKQIIKDTSHVLTFGAHKGHTVDTVLGEDPGYILWLSEQDWIDVDEKIVEMAKEYDFEDYSHGPAHNWSAYYGDDEPY